MKPFFWLLAAAGLCARDAALAQAPGATLPTVTVTGSAAATPGPARLVTGSASSPLDTPFSVTSVPSDTLRAQAATTLQDALRNVPGAQADSGFNGAHAQFFVLRGAVADSGTGASRVLRDGVRLSNYPFVPAFIDNIEVLRGPGAALGVRSEPGGTVNLTTRQPLPVNAVSVSAGAGTAGAQELTVDLNRVLSADDELAARIIATRSAAGAWRHLPDELSGLKLGIARSDGTRYHLRAGIEATDQRYRPDYGLPAIDGRLPSVPGDRQLGEPFGDSTTRNRIADLHADAAIGAATRIALDLTRLDAQSTSIKSFLAGSPLAGQPAGTFARGASWEPDTRRRIDSAAVSLIHRQVAGAASHTLYLGLERYRETLSQPTLSLPASASPPVNVYRPVLGLTTAPPTGAVLARSLTLQDLDATALSAQDQIDLGEWTLVAGLRLDRQDFVYGTAGVLPVSESRWSPKLGLLRRLGDNDTVYLNAGTGTAPNQVASSSNQSLPSRRSAQVEAGWKSLWQQQRIASEVAVYRLRQSNMISADQSTPLNNFDFTPGGSALSQGLEASLTGALTPALEVSASYAFTEAKYRDNSVYGGKDVPNVARHTLNLWAQYRWNENLKTGAGVYLQGRRFADEANTTVLPGYSRVDLVQTWTHRLEGSSGPQAFELQLALRNLLDKRYFVSSHLHVNRWIMPGQGRNLLLTASWRH